VIDSASFLSYRFSLALLQTLLQLYPDEFDYKTPPYEYEYERLPMDMILGSRQLRLGLESGTDIIELENSWQTDLSDFDTLRRSVFLYHN